MGNNQNPNEHLNHKDHFQYAIIAVIMAIAISMIAFKTADNNITAFAVKNTDAIEYQDLMVFEDINSMQSLAVGNYYVDRNGIVYWIDDSSMPEIARVVNLKDSQKNRQIYIDGNGNIGYVLK